MIQVVLQRMAAEHLWQEAPEADVEKPSAVNTILAGLALEAGQDRPDPVVGVLESSTDDRVANGQEVLDVPALIVVAFDTSLSPMGGDRRPAVTRDFLLATTYVLRDQPGAAGVLAASTTLLAARRSLDALAARPASARRRGDVELTAITGHTERSVRSSIGRSSLVATLLSTCTVREL